MLHPQPWIVLVVVLVGNCGFWLFCFNRVNAAGLPRKTTKRTEKAIVLLCFAIPTLIAAAEWPALLNWLGLPRWWPAGAPLFNWWGAWCLASTLVLGPFWLESRRWLMPPKHLLSSESTCISVGRALADGSTADKLTTCLNMLPGNQIAELELARKELRLPRPVAGVEGLRIGHLSDLHFSGQYRIEHYHYVIDRFLEMEPHLIVLTGDIIDHDRYLSWIEPVLGRLTAPLGCTFLLGNHDLRLGNVNDLLAAMESLGHFDLGATDQRLNYGDLPLYLTGNERPWFERHSAEQPCRSTPACSGLGEQQPVLRIGLSHTPDRIDWARRKQLDLLLAGHTHGGQARIPGIGPIISPSRHGSKFASGVFYLQPTLMHVSRGIAGTHPLRWWCRPEVSLLTLR